MTNGCTDKASGSTGKAPMETHDSTEKISCTARERSPQENQAGQRYIQVSLRKKQNCYLQFYRKTAKGFRQIKLMNNYLQRGHRKINIAYSRKMKTVTYKIRIYKKVNGRRKYSKFTKVKKMRLK